MTEEKPYTVAVFTAASMGNNPAYVQDACAVGRGLAENGIRLVYGGGAVGLMGIASRAALDAGGEVKGYTMACFNAESAGVHYPQQPFDELCEDIHVRKQRMMAEADAYIVVGGGLGTIDELTNAGVIEHLANYIDSEIPLKPIIVVDHGRMFEALMGLLDASIEQGFLRLEVKELFTKANDGVDAIEKLLEFKTQGGNRALCRPKTKKPETTVTIPSLSPEALQLTR